MATSFQALHGNTIGGSNTAIGATALQSNTTGGGNTAIGSGLIAEEVAQVNPDLVVRDSDGEIYTVRYDSVNAMLLNEFLKEHRKNEQQEWKIDWEFCPIHRDVQPVSVKRGHM